MRFEETVIHGAYLIHLDKKGDDRGFFARFFCRKEFGEMGLETEFLQVNNSLSAEQGTLRGMHYQVAPHEETKVVRCLKGSLYDAVLDLRPDSPSFGKSFGAELTGENRTMMYVPGGCAHGFLTLEKETEALYLVSAYYAPESERCVRWNDPKFSVHWPEDPKVISDKDAKAPLFDPDYHLACAEAFN